MSAQAQTPSIAVDSNDVPGIAYFDQRERALKYAWYVSDDFRIFRGESVASLTEVAHAILPWTDPDPVLTGAFPPLLFYEVESPESISLRKDGESITIFPHFSAERKNDNSGFAGMTLWK